MRSSNSTAASMLLITSTTEGDYPSDSVGMSAAVTDCSFVNGSAAFARQVWLGMRTCSSVNMVWESMWEVWMTARARIYIQWCVTCVECGYVDIQLSVSLSRIGPNVTDRM